MHHKVLRVFSRGISAFKLVDVSQEVSRALAERRPVLALESTIITHGMPYPRNLEMAESVEQIVREQGAVPATVGIIGGRVKVGLERDSMVELATLKTPAVKTSRRDFPYVLSKGLNGGTTVSGTIIVANLVGIKVFATGGIGGVHRGGEVSMDVSADLTELGRNPVTVVSSGVKSILDIGRTLEYLESQGVCVVTYGPTKDFPSFYTPCSPHQAPYHVESPKEAAGLIHSLLELGLQSGVLLGVPVPGQFSMAGEEIEAAIDAAVAEAEQKNITGKEVTPYILSRVSALTSGKSLDTNVALMLNNAKVGAQIAVELQRLTSSSSSSVSPGFQPSSTVQSPPGAPVVIGGSILDCTVRIKEDSIKADGSTHAGEMMQSAGGVGRNIADALGRLGTAPLLISALGADHHGNYILNTALRHVDTRGVVSLSGERTACYTAILDRRGECLYGVGDMDIHGCISPRLVGRLSSEVRSSRLVVMDGNVPEETVVSVLQLCKDAGVPVWFEPTDIRKASKPFHSELWRSLHFISPNFNELRVMAKAAGIHVNASLSVEKNEGDQILEEASKLAVSLVKHIQVLIVTLGKLGVMVVRRGLADEPLLSSPTQMKSKTTAIYARVYSVPHLHSVVSVSGAGDCLAAGIMAAMLSGMCEADCVSIGVAAARISLQSAAAVPAQLFPICQLKQHSSEIQYSTLITVPN